MLLFRGSDDVNTELVSTKTIVAFSIGAVGLGGYKFAPDKYRQAMLIGGVAATGIGILFLLNDAKANLEAFQAEGGLLGWVGDMVSGKPKPAIEKKETETKLPAPTPMEDGTKSANYVLHAAILTQGIVDVSPFSKTYPIVTRFSYKGPPASLAFNFQIHEESLWGSEDGSWPTPVIYFAGDGNPVDYTFNVPQLSFTNPAVSLKLMYQGDQYAFAYVMPD